MRIGIRYLNVEFDGPGLLREIAIAAEEAGLESLWVSDHVALPGAPTRPAAGRTAGVFVDPFVCLGYLASATRRLILGVAVVVLPLRHPLLVAKSAAAVWSLSAGRFRLGVGCGWLEAEFDALGVDFRSRGAVTDEYIRALRTAWSADVTSFSGRYAAWREMAVGPRPAGASIPIVIGGSSAAAVRRARQLGDEFFPTGRHRFALIRALRRHRPDMTVTLGISDDGADLAEAVVAADRVVLPARGGRVRAGPVGDRPAKAGPARADFTISCPEDVAPVADRVRDLSSRNWRARG